MPNDNTRLRDLIKQAIAEDDPEYYPNMYRDDDDQPHAGLSPQSIDRIAGIAATIAAAQGSGGVDRSKLLARISEDVEELGNQKDDKYLDGHGHAHLNGAIENLQALKIAVERGDFDTPQPGAGEVVVQFGLWMAQVRDDYLTAGAFRENDVIVYVLDEFFKRFNFYEGDEKTDEAIAKLRTK